MLNVPVPTKPLVVLPVGAVAVSVSTYSVLAVPNALHEIVSSVALWLRQLRLE